MWFIYNKTPNTENVWFFSLPIKAEWVTIYGDYDSFNRNHQGDTYGIWFTEYKYLDGQQAMEIMMKPMTKDDIGKSFQDLMIGRIYNYMIEQGIVRV